MQVQPGEFNSAVHCFRKTVSIEGITALWRGSFPALVGAVSENAVAFGVNGALRRILDSKVTSEPTTASPYKPFVNGSITGFFSAFVLCPADVVKCRSQLSRATGGTGHFLDIVKSTVAKDGFSGLYTGISAQILRDIPFYCFFFGTYELSCRILKDYWQLPESATYFISGT